MNKLYRLEKQPECEALAQQKGGCCFFKATIGAFQNEKKSLAGASFMFVDGRVLERKPKLRKTLFDGSD